MRIKIVFILYAKNHKGVNNYGKDFKKQPNSESLFWDAIEFMIILGIIYIPEDIVHLRLLFILLSSKVMIKAIIAISDLMIHVSQILGPTLYHQ